MELIHRMTAPIKSKNKNAAAALATAGDLSTDVLLRWYDRNRRHLPWRAEPGETPDPYRIWLSEIMLQQTTVETVKSYFLEFIRRWPTVGDLAGAELDDVLHCWQGLGYYARARNLHKCALELAGEHGGCFPADEDGLLRLPGIGAYTAAAISAIAYGNQSTPVDGNVERVFARIFAIPESGPRLKTAVRAKAAALSPERPGDFWQAVMDLGATVCRPRGPNCDECPWISVCAAHANGEAEKFPVKTAKKEMPTRHGVAFQVFDPAGSILLRRRPASGLLGGMIEVPSTEWRQKPWRREEAERLAPVETTWLPADGSVRHTFTHFHLDLTLLTGNWAGNPGVGAFWCAPEDLSAQALPTVMKKLLKLGKVLPR
jgi:A/G-specific adenine glycosylase